MGYARGVFPPIVLKLNVIIIVLYYIVSESGDVRVRAYAYLYDAFTRRSTVHNKMIATEDVAL